MTLTIDLTSAEEERLAAAARQAGLAPDALLKSLVSRLPLLPGVSKTAEAAAAKASAASAPVGSEAHAAAVQAAQGSLAHVGASVEDLHAQRQSDKAWEQAQDLGH